ncbi:MAG: oxidoreductase [Lautropia sp.]|nr:oxidoreductase [Lautropia sp.]
MSTFKAIVVVKKEDGQQAAIRDVDDSELMEGDVTVRVTHSTLNYKDALALGGRAPIVRRFPLIPGIDFAGEVEASGSADFAPGDVVVLTGWGAGETRHGGYAQRARWPAGQLVKLPQGMTAERAMAIGTAGLTAMLCVLALERHGVKPQDGPAVVTGAVGGVGSVAVALLARKGWKVIASTGRPQEADYLKNLGVSKIIPRGELAAAAKPLGKEAWVAGIDTVGSTTLANLCARTSYGGAIAACGLAGGMDLPASVAPFILRNVALLGVDSVQAPMALRQRAWERLAIDIDTGVLASMTTKIGLDQVITTAAELLAGKVRGRVVVEID